jgi:hypothetical protein
MKSNPGYLLLLICGLLVENTHGQNFKPIVDNNISFFSNSEGNVKALNIDSIVLSGTIQVYHLNKVWNFNDFQCVKPDGPSWIGKECIKDSDKYMFLNKVNDTIVFKPNDSLNSSWIFYKYNDGRFIQAKIVTKDNYEIFNTSDSIISISLQLRNKDGDKIESELNTVEIQISKSFGFIKIFSILDFPDNCNLLSIIGMTNPEFGKTFLTERKIYSFDINDEFHYDIVHSDAPNGIGKFTKSIKKIIGKYISANTDTVIYSVQKISQTQIIDWETLIQSNLFSVDTIKEKYVFKSNTLFLPEQPITNDGYSYSSYYLNINANNRLVLIPSGDYLAKGDNNCWGNIFYDPVGSSSYMEGCGLSSSDYDNFPSQSHETLVYYKKSNEVWGTPLILNSIPDIKDESFQVYPNPIGNNGLLTFNNSILQPCKLQLFNLLGEVKVEVLDLKIGENVINTSNLKSGLYLLRITDSFNNSNIVKLIKK